MSLFIAARNKPIPTVAPLAARDTPQPPAGAATQPKPGALAFVPFGEAAGSEKLLSGFRAVAQKQGPIAAVQWLAKNSGPLQALIKTPAGRALLATATLGFTTGWVAGSNASKVQALVTALRAVSDQRLPADQTARQVGQVLQAALSDNKSATPTQGNRINAGRPVAKATDSLAQAQIKLAQAQRVLAESLVIWKQNPSNPGQREIVQARQANVAKIQGEVNALMRAQASAGPDQAAPMKRPVPNVPVLPAVSQQPRPVGPVAKLPAAVNGKTAGSPTTERPPSPTFPKGIDHSAGASRKGMDRMGDVMREQRVNDYRNGRITREAATQGLSGGALTRMQAALDDIDRSKMPPGGVTGGRKSTASDAGQSPRSDATATQAQRNQPSQPTHENMDRLNELLSDDAKMAEHFDAQPFGKKPGSVPTSYMFGGHAANGPFAGLKGGNAYELEVHVNARVEELLHNGTLEKLSSDTTANDTYIYKPTGQVVRIGNINSEELSATVSYSNLRGRGKGAQLDLDQSLFMPKSKSFDANRSLGFGVLVMERVPGASLANITDAKGEGRLTSSEREQLKSVAGKVADALVDMHMQRRTHGDMHKGNVMFDKATGEVRLIDFGASRRTTDRAQREEDVHFLSYLILDGFGHNNDKAILTQATSLYLRALDRYAGPDRNAPVYKNHPELYEPHLKRFNERKAALRSEMAQ